ncbi:sulfotransferase domain-containing protein [Limibaculum sp. M0105]|uniref:Sulfotransferase domain-containing protein n=1 Tax=Thermohalobaculum xanthum TaxID=2753746 RepID=A0A8J7MAZ9_9RHOB|nr:sulfotransferase domain-containing protein [Thermohalobaculum xanthum]MBK0400968.1 sulfotransferase domain-containing protein [Thermohalobaculum xanthum]
MKPNTPTWPRKTREVRNHHFDSTIWNDFRFRPDDIVIGTYAKSGTTWVQQIVGQLIFAGDAEVNVPELSPWLDLRVPPKEQKLPMVEAQTHRRFLKTHLPVDALVFSPEAKYIYIGRDGRDVLWSMYNHHARANAEFYRVLNETPGLVGEPIAPPPASIRRYYHDWLDRDGHPFWPFWESIRSWWEIRDLPNVLLVHFADLKADMAGEIARIARFLEIEVDPDRWPAILDHCSFDHMKRNAARSAPLGGILWDGGAETFIHKGTNGRWRDVLTAQESEKYETLAVEKLGPEAAAWLASGNGSRGLAQGTATQGSPTSELMRRTG